MKSILQGPFSEADLLYLMLLQHLCVLQPSMKNRNEAYLTKIREGADMEVLIY